MFINIFCEAIYYLLARKMFYYSKKTPSEATFKAKIVDYEVKDSSRDFNSEFIIVDQNGKEMDLAQELPERYKAEVSISDLEVLTPPVRGAAARLPTQKLRS